MYVLATDCTYRLFTFDSMMRDNKCCVSITCGRTILRYPSIHTSINNIITMEMNLFLTIIFPLADDHAKCKRNYLNFVHKQSSRHCWQFDDSRLENSLHNSKMYVCCKILIVYRIDTL